MGLKSLLFSTEEIISDENTSEATLLSPRTSPSIKMKTRTLNKMAASQNNEIINS